MLLAHLFSFLFSCLVSAPHCRPGPSHKPVLDLWQPRASVYDICLSWCFRLSATPSLCSGLSPQSRLHGSTLWRCAASSFKAAASSHQGGYMLGSKVNSWGSPRLDVGTGFGVWFYPSVACAKPRRRHKVFLAVAPFSLNALPTVSSIAFKDASTLSVDQYVGPSPSKIVSSLLSLPPALSSLSSSLLSAHCRPMKRSYERSKHMHHLRYLEVPLSAGCIYA
ncbi:predicted protein [Postia placenta Mad-698-R]|nr:predicted protein [Postia placenta Mad-698-R]